MRDVVDAIQARLANLPGFVDGQALAYNLQATGQTSRVLDRMSDADVEALMAAWEFWGRPKQFAPVGSWRYWLMLPGRGFGKTRAGAEWVKQRVEEGARKLAIVGATSTDIMSVMVPTLEDVWPKRLRPVRNEGKRTLTFHNGALLTWYSAEKPDRIRGANIDTYWLDEFAAFRYASSVMEQVRMSMRDKNATGTRCLITTTPRPTKEIRAIVEEATQDLTVQESKRNTVVVYGSTFENTRLDAGFLKEMRDRYLGTRIGRQELMGEVLTDTEGALWKLEWIDEARVIQAPMHEGKLHMARVVVAVDPTVSESEQSDECGIVVCGVGYDGAVYVLDDLSRRYGVHEWPSVVVQAVNDWSADCVVAEVNQGGDLVKKAILEAGCTTAAVRTVHAKVNKRLRAEVVVQKYEQRKIHHVGVLPKLEDQMTTWVPSDSKGSPDRVDALVYAVMELVPTIVAQAARVHSRPRIDFSSAGFGTM